MSQPLRILFIEDLPTDTELAEWQLHSEGLDFISLRVETRDAYLQALDEFLPDLIISDYSLPEFDGMQALKLTQEMSRNIPFIILTGSMNEETAAECIKAGANDYVIKEHIHRLPFAVQDVMKQQQIRNERAQAVEQLRENEMRYRAVVNSAKDAIITIDSIGNIVDWNPSAERIFGFTINEAFNKPLTALMPARYHNAHLDGILRVNDGGEQHVIGKTVEMVGLRNEGSEFPMELSLSEWKIDSQKFFTAIIRDISERKQADETLAQERRLLRTVIDNVPAAIYFKDLQGRKILANREDLENIGLPESEVLGKTDDEVYPPDVASRFMADDQSVIKNDQAWLNREEQLANRQGKSTWLLTSKLPLKDAAGKTVGLVGIGYDITERKQIEDTLHQRLAELEAVYSLSIALRQTQTIDEVLKILLDKSLQVLETDTGAIWLFHKDRNELERVVARGWIAQSDEGPLKPDQGIAGMVFASQLTHFFADFSSESLAQIANDFKLQNGWGGACFPILSSEETEAVLFTCVPLPRQISIEQIKLLESMTGIAGNTIQRIRLYKDAQEQASQLGLLYDAGLALNSVLEPGEQLKFLFTIAMNTLNTERAAFFRYNPKRDELVFEMGLGFDKQSLDACQRNRFQAKDEGKSLGWVAQNRLPLNLAELSSLSLAPMIDPQILSELYAPVKREQTLIGVLCVFSLRKKAFSPQSKRLLLLFANQAAVAIQNARLITETRRRLEYLKALRLIDTAIAGSFELPRILDVVLEQVITQQRVDAACVLLFNPRNLTLEYAAGRGFHTNALQNTHLEAGDGFAGMAFQERKPIHVPDLRAGKTSFSRSPNFSAEEFIDYYAIPLAAKEEIVGVLEIFHRSHLDSEPEWFDFLETLSGQAAIAINNALLLEELKNANLELSLAYDVTIEGWSKALDLRDKETEGHTQRVTEITQSLAQAMGMSREELVHIRRGSLLHDIGKLGVPDQILLKPGPLTEDEWKIMKKHPVYALDMIASIDFLKPAVDIPYCHHENWDGSGYPRGLKGEDIPLAARIFAIVDVWDALTNDRPYRRAWSKETALSYIREQSGKQFDPSILNKFLSLYV